MRPQIRLAGNRKIRAGADEDFFQATHVFDCTQRFALAVRSGESAQVEDGVADELPGAVESDIAAAITFEHFHSALLEKLW